MLLNKTPLLLIAMAMSTLAFTVPADTPDGVYVVSTDDKGNDIHTKLAEPTSFTNTKRGLLNVRMRTLVSRDITNCGDGQELNHGDTDAANADLDVQCGGTGGVFVPGGLDWYSKRGGTVAFFCNFGGNNRCDSASRQRSSATITSVCGWYKPGWTGPNEGYLTYGYDHVSSNFCGRH